MCTGLEPCNRSGDPDRAIFAAEAYRSTGFVTDGGHDRPNSQGSPTKPCKHCRRCNYFIRSEQAEANGFYPA
jgi:hypothetical protein